MATVDLSVVELDATDRSVGRALRAQGTAPGTLGPLVGRALRRSTEHGTKTAKALLATVDDLAAFDAEATELITWATRKGRREQVTVAAAVLEGGGRPAELFLVQRISEMTRPEATGFMRAYVEAGGSTASLAEWLALAGRVLRRHGLKRAGTAGAVVDAIGDAAEWVVDTLEDGVDALLEAIQAVIEAVIDAGVAIATVLTEAAAWTIEQLTELITALFEAGIALGEFIVAVFEWTYDAASRFVGAALEAGATVAELIGEVARESYWAFRRIVNGLFEQLGRVGEILDAVFDRIEGVVDELWRRTLLALRFAGAVLTDALDWMGERIAVVIDAVLWAWESIGEDLIDFYRWAAGVSIDVWQWIGEATVRLGNSVSYLLGWIVDDVVAGLFHLVQGFVRAGFAVAELVAWCIEFTVDVAVEVLGGLLAVGVTLGELLVAIAQEPRAAFDLVVAALRDIGTTIADLYAAIVDEAEELLGNVVLALYELGEAVADIIEAMAEIHLGKVGVVIGVLLSMLATYRPLSDDEIADARTVFGDGLDYDRIFVSAEDLTNDIIFGIQGWWTGQATNRAFTVDTLINHDPDDGPLDRPTLIHELAHVWQFEETGPFYMMEALHAQILGEGYNYGYAEPVVLGVGDGTTTTFGGALGALPVAPRSVRIVEAGVGWMDQDDGSGGWEFGSAGTIDYATGALTVTLPSAPAAGNEVQAWRVVQVEVDYAGTIEGHDEGWLLGLGGEQALVDAGGDFEAFNREQQGQILQHWFVRTRLALTDLGRNPRTYDATAWQPYRDAVFV